MDLSSALPAMAICSLSLEEVGVLIRLVASGTDSSRLCSHQRPHSSRRNPAATPVFRDSVTV
eukprot:1031011-Pyramimonas_sp.AAC.1